MLEPEWPGLPTLASVLFAATVSFLVTPVVRNFARFRGWLDRPDGRRKLHVTPVPRLGGVPVFVAFGLTLALLVALQRSGVVSSGLSASAYLHLLIASAAVVAVGVADDVYELRPLSKILIQSAAGLYLYWEGYRVNVVSNPFSGESVRLGLFSMPLTVLWFVAMSNAFNLIDGLDGLAAGLGLFSTTTLFIACVLNEKWEIAIIAAALGGALLGFLRYNFNPASIFLGDSGALFLGFALAAVALRGSMKSSAAMAVAAPLMALAVPILDASIAVFRRLIRGDHPFRADSDHIHHRLLRMGLTPRRVVAVLYAVAAAFGALSLLTMTGRGQIVGMVIIAASMLTWIGIHQLGYAEFGEIQRTLRYGVGNQRRAIGNNVYLAALAARFGEVHDLDQLWALLGEAMTRLEFLTAEVEVDASRAPVPMRRLTAWKGTGEGEGQPTSIWRIPVISQGEILATIVLVRALRAQTQFDSSQFLNAIENGFLPRLLHLSNLGATMPAPVRAASIVQH